MRPELKRMLKQYTRKQLAKFLGTTHKNIHQCVYRGYLSHLLAERAEARGDWKARLLVKK